MRWISKFAKDQRGGTLIEYGLIVALIVIAMFGSLNTFAGSTINLLNHVSNSVMNAG